MSQTNKPDAKKSPVSPLTITLIILGILGLSVGWYFFKGSDQTPPAKPATQSTDLSPNTPSILPATPLTAESQNTPDTTAVPSEPPVDTTSACEQTEKELTSFFASLDNTDYIGAHQLKGGSQKYFSLLIDKLLAKPPVVAREKESLTSILHNTAHLYRTLGKNDVALIKETLEQENDSLEPAMALFYRWSELAPKCELPKTAIRLPFRGLYEYAGFFLNTLGGQSYLYRRDSRVRLLGQYYSILILDRANDTSLNRYGIDIRPSVDSLLDEMKNTSSLKERDTYLARLILLRDKYLARYGAKIATPVSAQ